MGSYLDVPNTEKHAEDGEEGADCQQYAVSEMQGWRKTMEDAHITRTTITPERHKHGPVSLYGVFDGHGGKEVAGFCAKYLPLEIVQLKSFEDGDFEVALIESFHRMDEMLRDSTYAGELSRFRDLDVPMSVALQAEKDDQKEEEDGAGDKEVGVRSIRESIQADVQKQMVAAEQKGSLTKTEALDLVVKMMKVKKLTELEADSKANGAAGAAMAQYTDAGCTAIVALLHDKTLYVANAGDSRAIMCSAGKAVALSQDHKPFQDSEMSRIRQAGGYVNEFGRVNGNLNLSRSIGDLKYKADANLTPDKQVITAQPDVKVFKLSDEDEYVFIACDGVFDVMSNDSVVSFVNKRLAEGVDPLSAVLGEIFEACICDSPGSAQGIGADNMTAILVLLKPISYFSQGTSVATSATSTKASARMSKSKDKNN